MLFVSYVVKVGLDNDGNIKDISLSYFEIWNNKSIGNRIGMSCIRKFRFPRLFSDENHNRCYFIAEEKGTNTYVLFS